MVINESDHMPSVFKGRAVGRPDDSIHSPSINELLQMTPEAIEGHLGLNDMTIVRDVIDAPVRVLQDEFKPLEVYIGGSFIKKTALKVKWDIDLVMKRI